MADEEEMQKLLEEHRLEYSNSLAYQKRSFLDYLQCVIEKEIATASCETWEQTVHALASRAVLFGKMLGTAERMKLEEWDFDKEYNTLFDKGHR